MPININSVPTASIIPNIILDDEQLSSFDAGFGCFVTDEFGEVKGFAKKEDVQDNLKQQEFHERAREARASLHLLEILITQNQDYLDLNELAREGLGVFLKDQQERLSS